MDEHPNQEITIHIDRAVFKVGATSLSGAQLRVLPTPPVGEERDLVIEVPGGHDRVIADDEVVQLHDGIHFFTTPRHITPG